MKNRSILCHPPSNSIQRRPRQAQRSRIRRITAPALVTTTVHLQKPGEYNLAPCQNIYISIEENIIAVIGDIFECQFGVLYYVIARCNERVVQGTVEIVGY